MSLQNASCAGAVRRKRKTPPGPIVSPTLWLTPYLRGMLISEANGSPQ